MNINKLWEYREYMCESGAALSNEQTALLQNSLFLLQNENHFSSVFYWGQIYGVNKDYYIAYGFEKDALNDRKVFQSVDLKTWNVLAHAKKKYKELTLLCNTPFNGDPGLKVKVIDESLDELHSERCKLMKEEARLAAIVSIISEEAEICARGQFLKKADGSVVLNEHFYGLSTSEGKQLKSYLHLRMPQQRWNTNLLTRLDYNYSLDCFDSIDTDVPAGCWNVAVERGGTIVCLRSLYWPGMLFFHKMGTCDVGFTYMGNGKKNLDVCNVVISQ